MNVIAKLNSLAARLDKTAMPKDGTDIIEGMREIVKNHQYAKIRGITVDGFTASAVVQVFDRLSEANQQKFLALNDVKKMVNVTWKLVR